ncbi:MAG: AAA family ATPase [Patescibacteria group bacterium]
MNKAISGVEIERRFLVKGAPTVEQLDGWKSKRIVQGYFGTQPGKVMRIRIVDDRYAIFTVKSGNGIRRSEHELDTVDVEMGRAALETCLFILAKTRYVKNGWELDLFEGPLKGLVMLERELATEDEVLPPFPDFLEIEREVTSSINNLALAEASTLLAEGSDPAQLLSMMAVAPLPMIVLTGGPCSGKSTSMRELQDQYPKLAFVPEVATLVIAHAGIKPPLGDEVGMAKFQRLIYGVQRAFEHAAQDQAIRDGKKAIILDRGSMDNAAYVPGGVDGLAKILQTSAADEYARYHAVLCLSQPSREVYEQMKVNNPARSEDYETAEGLSGRIQASWGSHVRYHRIPTGKSWDEVSDAVHGVIRQLLNEL